MIKIMHVYSTLLLHIGGGCGGGGGKKKKGGKKAGGSPQQITKGKEFLKII